jgi:hypothetical protein
MNHLNLSEEPEIRITRCDVCGTPLALRTVGSGYLVRGCVNGCYSVGEVHDK